MSSEEFLKDNRRFFLSGLFLLAASSTALGNTDTLLQQALPVLRLERQDLNVRPDRWETSLTLPAVERLLQDPLTLSSVTSEWNASLHQARRSSELIQLAAHFLETPLKSAPPAPLAQALQRAQKYLQQALQSLSPQERQTLLRLWRSPLLNENEIPDESAVRLATHFHTQAILQAGYELTQAVDEILQRRPADLSPRRVSLAAGDLWIVGPGNKTFSETDLRNVACLIKTGGTSHYHGAIAAAGPGQIRLVIDFSENVTVESEEAPQSAGSGFFGIGLFYLPNARGIKIIRSGDFSQGAGYFGIGGFFMNASSSTVTGHRFTQGAGSFGLGLFSNAQGSGTVYKARYGGQGAGFTQGIGLFIHRGQEATIEGGLYFSDPREPQAMVSFCQGTGYGPRAISGGGLGLAVIDGDRNQLTSSYFAQGSGYWHSLGNLAVYGQGNRLQARRYDQGAGIHTALGHLHLEGNNNQTINWGVGPAYGWDYGVGLFTVEGHENRFYAEWATGHGEVNGYGLATIQGNKNQIFLPGFGTGTLSRNAPSYGVAVVEGDQNQYALARLSQPLTETSGSWEAGGNKDAVPAFFPTTPWGVLVSSGTFTFNPTLKFPKPEWPVVEGREKARKKEHQTLAQKLEMAQPKPAHDRIADLISIASSFSLDDEIPQKAAKALLRLKDEDLAELVHQVSPTSVDEYLQLKLLFSAYGPKATPLLQKEITQAQGTRKALLLNLLGSSRIHEVIDSLVLFAQDPDWRVRRAATGTLAALFSWESGRVTGRIRLLLAAQEAFQTKRDMALNNEMSMPELFGVLALAGTLKDEDRVAFYEKNPSPFDHADQKTLNYYYQLLQRQPDLFKTALAQELEDTSHLEGQAREVLLKQLHDPEQEVVQAAVIGLGQMNDPENTSRIAPFLEHSAAYLREAAASALAKMGETALSTLVRALRSPKRTVREMALISAGQSHASSVQSLLVHGLEDPNPWLRQTALSVLSQLDAPSKVVKRDLRKLLIHIKTSDSEPTLRLMAELSLPSFK